MLIRGLETGGFSDKQGRKIKQPDKQMMISWIHINVLKEAVKLFWSLRKLFT